MTWRMLPFWILAVLAANSLLGFAGAYWGGDWRDPFPSVTLGLIFGELSVCATNVSWGRGSLVARVLIQFAAIAFAIPVAAFAIRTTVTRDDLVNWLATLVVYSTIITFCLIGTRVVGATARFPNLVSAKDAVPLQWSLRHLFSVMTAAALWLGLGLAVSPLVGFGRHSPLHWGTMLFVDVGWIPFVCAACVFPTFQKKRLIWLPFAVAPIVALMASFFEVGQGDSSLQLWLAGLHQEKPGLDYMLSSGVSARIIVTETTTALMTIYFAIWQALASKCHFRDCGL